MLAVAIPDQYRAGGERECEMRPLDDLETHPPPSAFSHFLTRTHNAATGVTTPQVSAHPLQKLKSTRTSRRATASSPSRGLRVRTPVRVRRTVLLLNAAPIFREREYE